MRVLALGAALLWASLSASASSAPAFSCVFGDGAFLLAVDPSPPYGYAVTSRGAAFLENGTLAVAVGGAASGAFLSPGSGLAAAGPPAGNVRILRDTPRRETGGAFSLGQASSAFVSASSICLIAKSGRSRTWVRAGSHCEYG